MKSGQLYQYICLRKLLRTRLSCAVLWFHWKEERLLNSFSIRLVFPFDISSIQHNIKNPGDQQLSLKALCKRMERESNFQFALAWRCNHVSACCRLLALYWSILVLPWICKIKTWVVVLCCSLFQKPWNFNEFFRGLRNEDESSIRIQTSMQQVLMLQEAAHEAKTIYLQNHSVYHGSHFKSWRNLGEGQQIACWITWKR